MVYVFPDSVPPQPVTEVIWYPVYGETVNVAVEPWFTIWVVLGLMMPPTLTEGVTVKVLIAKVALTVQLLVIAPVVYVFPDSVPPQPVTEAMW